MNSSLVMYQRRVANITIVHGISYKRSSVWALIIFKFKTFLKFNNIRKRERLYSLYIHTYIIGHYNPSVLTDQLLKPLLLGALTLNVSRGAFSLTPTPNDNFLRNFFMAGLFTLRVLARNLLRGNRRRNIFFFSYFVLMPDLGYESRLYV